VSTQLIGALTFLRQHSFMQYTQLIDIVVSDVPGAMNRFSVCYLLYSPFYNTKLHLITKVDEITPLPSIVHLFESAN
jgi:NADH dehydrogenase (ubiquinone) Fe-S protein 3